MDFVVFPLRPFSGGFKNHHSLITLDLTLRPNKAQSVIAPFPKSFDFLFPFRPDNDDLCRYLINNAPAFSLRFQRRGTKIPFWPAFFLLSPPNSFRSSIVHLFTIHCRAAKALPLLLLRVRCVTNYPILIPRDRPTHAPGVIILMTVHDDNNRLTGSHVRTLLMTRNSLRTAQCLARLTFFVI